MNKTPLMVDLCEDCNKPFWINRGHIGSLYCAYCGKVIARFGDK